MTFSDKTLTLLVLVSLGVSGLALFLLWATASRRRDAPRLVSAEGELTQAMREQAGVLGRLREAVRRLSEEDARLAALLRDAVQRVGMVRYDAFEDMGGHLSFSAAFLDGKGDGVVITSINGRADTRCYAKPVRAGTSAHNLSEEEEQAIRQALAREADSVAAP